ncbi:DNA topoisomerase IV subunit A [Sporolactobacillus terrae]|uniref:DNA topoisomerase 4 subunit A n=1 Tax=Sporolactobacillus terrae TaxID=269673 RepID=A0ABX5Q7C2_9BACL|nr:DNA topoisomerase IV subunit A [Sporolactobacillus terrae]QAA22523.1 DNA topoisomerase IV subunit A [Sporolactobacillus terrae]QAA25497.1 DNA topoisomerase IV subunit A [Sporolactobacillus terrae]UAK17308.1 DNA topoisomerase IV subunit A [Sporolactobacillus terrae]
MANNEKLLNRTLEEVMGDRFGIYSKYIIQERALPDVRDGLKPVQRRILYAMLRDGNTSDKPFRKSAKTVGNVIGNYHPHGDSSVYEAMVRMSQDWKVRMPLIEMHGNNGSLDGDPPAAMRYTEARLSKISAELLRDIDAKTVDYILNFDDTTEEPTVFPSKFPNLLVNGSTGISAGYATEIPPHCLSEIIDATVHLMEHSEATVDDLMHFVKGPDFPTGGIVQGLEGIKKAYRTGKGKIVLRGRTKIETLRTGRKQIIITELPYEVNKALLVKKMDELRLDHKVEGVSEVRDETDRSGMRVIIELKKDADPNGILNYYFKNTDLQITYNFNMVAIDRKTPRQLGLKDILQAYIAHQKEVVTRRSKYELQKSIDRQHIVRGLIKAISILDDVIRVIRSSKDKKNAKQNLSESFGFTEAQAEAIVNLQLYRLTNTDIVTLQKEEHQLDLTIARLKGILGSEKKLIAVIRKELLAVRDQFADPRRTTIEAEIEEIKIDLEVMVASEEVMVALSKHGYVKRSSLRSYAASGNDSVAMKETDHTLFQQQMNTTDTLLVFTDKGRYVYLPVHEIQDRRWKELGQHLASIVPIEPDELIISAVPVKDFTETTRYMTFFTKNGMVKRTKLSAYHAQRRSKPLTALKLKKNDTCLSALATSGTSDLVLVTHNGYCLRFKEEDAGEVGTRASGVKAVQLKPEDYVAGARSLIKEASSNVVIVTDRGAVKQMALEEQVECTGRPRRGVQVLRELKTKPHHIVGFERVQPKDKLTLFTNKGKLFTVSAAEIRLSDRYSNGSFILDQEEDGMVSEVWKEVASED